MLALASALVVVPAHATTGDTLATDLAVMPQFLDYNWASNPAAAGPHIALPFTLNRRMAYSQEAPLQLPCDVDALSVGMSFRNVGADPVYVELSGTLAINGQESNLIANVYGQTEPHAPLGVLVAPDAVSTGGFIVIARPPYYDFLASQLPANVPVKVRMRSQAFTNSNYDPYRGGYYLSNAVSESVVWNNAFTVWVQRACPAS